MLLKGVSRCLGTRLRSCRLYSSATNALDEDDYHRVTFIPGDGVWQEMMPQIRKTIEQFSLPIKFEELRLSESFDSEDYSRVIESVQRNKVLLKGIIQTPQSVPLGERRQSKAVRMRLDLDLYANVVSVKPLKGVSTRHTDFDYHIIRESLEGEYSGIEHSPSPGVAESLKVVTRHNSMRIAKFAFDFARRNNRKLVHAIHKANIMKESDGLFLRCCSTVAKEYSMIEFKDMIVDNCSMQLVSRPEQFDVMVMGNLYGAIMDNASAGLIGGAGVLPGASYSDDVSVFEPGARHVFASGAGKDMANPTAGLLCAVSMLNHLNLRKEAKILQDSIEAVILDGNATLDIGGSAGTHQFLSYLMTEIEKRMYAASK